MLNEENIRRLIKSIGGDTARELVGLFLDETRRRLERMAELAGAGDLKALELEAHSLLGSAETYGIQSLGDTAGELESACLSGDAGRARDLMAELAGTAPELLSDLEPFVAAEI
jgi:HPt (histidine-containing phosphotransfer) domain-containing protein